MKKLLFVLVTFIMLPLLSGCNESSPDTTVRFDQEGQTNTEENTAPAQPEEKAPEAPAETIEKQPEGNTDKTPAVEQPEAQKNEASKDMPKDESDNTATSTAREANGALSLTNVKNNLLETNLNYNVIRGTVPQGTAHIEVNGYSLKKYVAGQKTWSYIAATRMGTMKDGNNRYAVSALDKNGKEIASLDFTVKYDAKAIPTLPGVGLSLWASLILSLAVSTIFYIRKYKF